MKASQDQLYQYMRERIAWAFDCDAKTGSLYSASEVNTGYFGSKCLLPPWAFSQTPVVVAVNALSPINKTLVFFSASLPVSKADLADLMVPLWFEFYKAYHVNRRLNGKTLPRAQRLLEWALIQYKTEIDGNQHPTKDKQIMQAIGVNDAKTYRRDWTPRLSIMKSIIAEKERAALSEVLSYVDQRREQQYA